MQTLENVCLSLNNLNYRCIIGNYIMLASGSCCNYNNEILTYSRLGGEPVSHKAVHSSGQFLLMILNCSFVLKDGYWSEIHCSYK